MAQTETVNRIFNAFKRVKVIAAETGVPIQTACDWRQNGNIPHWRRGAVLDAAKRKGIALDADSTAFLISDMSAEDWEASKAEAKAA